MKVEPSGVVMIGICDVQTPKCRAKELSAITAVWTSPGRSQVNVCSECLEEMVRAGEWEIPRARISPHADVAVLSKDMELGLVIEVKKRPYHDSDLVGFATRAHRNLVLHSAIPSRVFFMLALFPSPFYLWLPDSAQDPNARPDFEIACEAEMLRRLDLVAQTAGDEYRITEHLIADWIKDILADPATQNTEGAEWLYDSRLLDKVRDGNVVQEYRL